MSMPGVESSDGLEAIAYSDLDGRPAFKLGLSKDVDGAYYLYCGHLWHRGWTILEVTDPAAPQLVDFIEGPPNTWTVQMSVVGDTMVTALERQGGPMPERAHLWGGDPEAPFSDGIWIWSLSDRTKPQRKGEFKTGGTGTHRNYYPGGDTVFLAGNLEGFHGNIFVAVDISSPEKPFEIGRWWYPGQWIANGETPVHDTHLYHHGPPYVVDNLAYLAYGRGGMIILDVSDLEHPRRVGELDIGDFGSLVGVHTVLPLPDRDIAVVTTEPILEDTREPLNLFIVVDITDPSNPKPLASIPDPPYVGRDGLRSYYERPGKFGAHNLHLPQNNPNLAPIGDRLHVAYESAGLWIYDVRDPLSAHPIAHFLPEGPKKRHGHLPKVLGTQTEDVLVDERGYIYVSDKNHGVFILRETL